MRMVRLLSLGLLLFCGLSSASNAKEIKFGYNGDLSGGPSAEAGQATLLGTRAAIDEINANGGLLGKQIRLVVRDDLGQPPKSIQNMSDLVDNEKVVAVMGPPNSGNAMAWKHIPNQKKVPTIIPSTATALTKPMSDGADNYMFRVSVVDRMQVSALLAYAKASGSQKVGFAAETTGYGQGGMDDMLELGKLYEIKPVAIEKFGFNDTDMTSQLAKMRSAGVDTMVVWAQGAPIGQLVRSMEKMNYYPKLLTSWASNQPSFFNVAGSKLAELPVFLQSISSIKTLNPSQRTLYDKVRDKLPSDSVFVFTAHAYDAIHLLAKAITQAQSVDGNEIRLALENLEGTHAGVMKVYERPFSSSSHEALIPTDYQWTTWRNGELSGFSDDSTEKLTTDDFILD